MPTEIIDLDDALPPDKQVRLGDAVYRLPGDIPVELFLRVQRANTEVQTAGVTLEAIEDLRNAILDLFRVRSPQLKALPTSVGIGQLVTMLARTYAGPQESAPPTRRTRGGTGSKARASRSLS